MLKLLWIVLGVSFASVTGTAVSYWYQANSNQAMTTTMAERNRLESCLPKAREMNLSDIAVHANDLFFIKSVEISASKNSPEEARKSVKEWLSGDFIHFVATLPEADQKEIRRISHTLREDKNAQGCLIRAAKRVVLAR